MAANSDQARIATTLNIFQNAVRRADLNFLLAVTSQESNFGPVNSADTSFCQALLSFYEQFNLDSLEIVENPGSCINALRNFYLSLDSCHVNDNQAGIRVLFNWPVIGTAKDYQDYSWLDLTLEANKWYFSNRSQLWMRPRSF
jgi:hypothetical protein